jgi:Holliday junction resolvase RusA-like endonuclease
MKSPNYIIPGPPIPQPRARILRNGFSYDPRSKEKQNIKAQLLAQRNANNSHMLTCPVFLDITFFMPIPAATSKKKELSLWGKPCTKKNGDIDNLLKLYLDCFINVLLLDDSQVFSLFCSKIYAPKNSVRTEFYFTYGESENG